MKKSWLRGKGAARKPEAQRTDWCQMRMISQGERKLLDLINEHGDLDPLFPATRSCHLLLVKCDKMFVSKIGPQRGKPLSTRQLMLYHRVFIHYTLLIQMWLTNPVRS